jgi:hypothetical protein
MNPGSGAYSRSLLDGQTFAVVDPVNDTGSGFRWMFTEENVAYAGGAPADFRWYTASVASGLVLTKSVAVTALSGTYASMRPGGGYGSQSLSDTLMAGDYKKTNGWVGINVMQINLATRTVTVIAERDLIQDTGSGDWNQYLGHISVSPSGLYVYHDTRTEGTAPYQGAWVYDIDLNTSNRRQITTRSSHMDVARLTDGTDVVVMGNRSTSGQLQAPGRIGYYRMSNGAYTEVVHQNYSSQHISGRCVDVPGYVVVSSASPGGTFPGKGEVIALELASGLVRRYGHIHGPYDTSEDGQTQASVSADMEVVVAATSWDGGPIGCVAMGMDIIGTSMLP